MTTLTRQKDLIKQFQKKLSLILKCREVDTIETAYIFANGYLSIIGEFKDIDSKTLREKLKFVKLMIYSPLTINNNNSEIETILNTLEGYLHVNSELEYNNQTVRLF